MDEFEKRINRGQKRLWAVLGIICLGSAVFAGAWWHLFTAAICGIMYLATRAEENKEDQPDDGRA